MRIRTHCLLSFLLLTGLTRPLHAQGGNFDWELIWERPQPLPTSTDHWKWMAGMASYTGLAYDPIRDVLYIVNPALDSSGTQVVGAPRIHIWDAKTGNPKTTLGRTALGAGGELPMPPDTIRGFPGTGWPGTTHAGYGRGRYPVYKIDVDEAGRIFASNLVSPVWGTCYPGPPPNCDADKFAQGPFRVYRWDTPSSTPRLVYSTLNTAHTGSSGSSTDTEMKWTRWGDVLEVVGGPRTVLQNGQPVTVDSVRIYTSGGHWTGSTLPAHENDEINVIIGEDRTEQQRVSDGLGRKLPYRLGVRLVNGIAPNTLRVRSAHGIAVMGSSSLSPLWHDTNGAIDLVTRNDQAQTSAPFPQTFAMTRNHTLSSDPVTGTGATGPLAYVNFFGWHLLAVCDAQPDNPSNPTADNSRTRARVMDVNTIGQEFRAIGAGETPWFGRRNQHSVSGTNNYIADIDIKVDTSGSPYGPQVLVFVLQSNNGIAAFRTRWIPPPVQLESFTAVLEGDDALLTWMVASETNNTGWHVQRSFDGGFRWEDLTFVAGRGSTQEGATYTHRDALTSTHHAIGSAAYRIVQQDADGTQSTSHIVEVQFDASLATNGFVLHQNHPNPFNPNTTIGFTLRETGFVTLKVFNQMGEQIATLFNESRDAGVHNVTFDASTLPSGTYIYQISVDGRMQQKKMVLMK
jgi:hypothetical protein